MSKLTVALICGGVSSERAVSLAGGQEILKALNPDRYRVLQYDPKTDLDRMVREAGQIDTAFVNLHGLYGEDGTIQGVLDLLGIPYQCSGVLGSALAMNKLAAKRIYEQAGLQVPPYRVVSFRERGDLELLDAHAKALGLPVVVKPACGGSSVGMSIVKTLAELARAVDKALAHDTVILLESYIRGRELTGGILGNTGLEALPIVEIIPGAQYTFFDYEAKYTPGATSEICPAPIPESLAIKAQEYARRAHQALFCKGYSRTDMIAADGDLFVLETNTIPGMAPTSLLPLAARTAGISFDRLLDRLIDLSLEKA
ncbi:MAG: D-alanine--D-alanine ligase family protein [Thermodesulfobacteriota bacterium]